VRGYGNEWERHFFIDAAASLVVEPSSRPPFAVTRLISSVSPPDITTTIPTEDSFLISVALQPMGKGSWEHWSDGKSLKVPFIPPFHASIFDLQAGQIAWVKTAFDYLHFNVPRQTIDAFTDEHDLSRVTAIRPTICADDHAIANLTRLILPFLSDPKERSELFLDYFGLLLCSRLVEGYASVASMKETHRGGLAPWQKRRAEELLMCHLGGNLRLERLARECRLSPGHFARAFKVSFGVSVHRWVVDRRIEYGKALLTQSTLALPEIAFRTGFSSQSTFTRAFQQRVGIGPGQWRRNVGPASRQKFTGAASTLYDLSSPAEI
jgi:AraC family transcriptional regulator